MQLSRGVGRGGVGVGRWRCVAVVPAALQLRGAVPVPGGASFLALSFATAQGTVRPTPSLLIMALAFHHRRLGLLNYEDGEYYIGTWKLDKKDGIGVGRSRCIRSYDSEYVAECSALCHCVVGILSSL